MPENAKKCLKVAKLYIDLQLFYLEGAGESSAKRLGLRLPSAGDWLVNFDLCGKVVLLGFLFSLLR